MMANEMIFSSDVIAIFAPFGKDAEALSKVVMQTGMHSSICVSAEAICAEIGREVRAVLITVEALIEDHEVLASCLHEQPTWSDIPILLLQGRRAKADGIKRWFFLQQFRNITVLDRPVSAGALRLSLDSAYRARAVQFRARDQMQELQAYSNDLEKRVEERTESLRSEIEQRKRIETTLLETRRLEALGRLTGGVAHDFNNLLQVITTSATMLRHMLDDISPVERFIDNIERSTEKASRLTHQLLSFGRRQALSSVTVNIEQHIREIQELLQQSLREKISLELDFPHGLWEVCADPTQLDIALVNLAMNAKEAMPRGGTVKLSACNVVLPSDHVPLAEALSGEFVWVSFCDNGPGMAADVQAQAFDPFFTTKGAGEGSGLGLSQVYGFAKQSGGTAWIDTSPLGTCISMALPRGISTAQRRARKVHYSLDMTDCLAGLRILVVEDDDAVAETTMTLLEEFGSKPVRACNADEALQVDLAEIDLVFSDVIMPGSLDGLALAQKLLQQDPHLPIILTSGYVVAPERLQEQDITILMKPFSEQALRQVLIEKFTSE